MDQISLALNKDRILSFFEGFHTLTGIKIALFSGSGKEILSYPEEHCPFCGFIRSSEDGNNTVILTNGNWINELGWYDATSETFTPNSGVPMPDAAYISRKNSAAQNTIKISYLILDETYFAKRKQICYPK